MVHTLSSSPLPHLSSPFPFHDSDDTLLYFVSVLIQLGTTLLNEAGAWQFCITVPIVEVLFFSEDMSQDEYYLSNQRFLYEM